MVLTKRLLGRKSRSGEIGPYTSWRLAFILFLLLWVSHETGAQSENQDQETHLKRPRLELEEVVVTATRQDERIRRIPKNVTVITAEDIEQAPSNNVVDLISRESGINLRSFSGNDKGAVLDIRGMGDTSTSNVIVMVDGVRLNPPDLAGPDLSSVPLYSIERIEIVRGAGSVAYGSGAVGGVINIITKKAKKRSEAKLYGSYGSYETVDGRASYSGKTENLGFNINGAYYDSDGYRDNGYYRKMDARGRVGYDVGQHVTISGSVSYHEDDYGLPGGVSKEDKDSKDRRKATDRPDDAGDTTDRRYVGMIEIDMERVGGLEIQRGYRRRDNAFVLGFSPLLTREAQTTSIDEDTKHFNLGYNLEFQVLGLDQRLHFGIDDYDTEYVREERSKDQRQNSDTDTLGVFVMSQNVLSEKLSLQLGYRYNNFDGDFRTDKHQIFGSTKRWINGTPVKKEWTNHAEEVGFVYSFRPETMFFVNYATSFRVPNVDELAQAQGDLIPQEGTHIDIGGRTRYRDVLEVAMTFFEIKIDDEIFFDGNLELNRNYDDKTVRRGVEADVRLYVTDEIYLWGNYTYTDAKFDNRNTTVPLVPEHMVKGGMEWQPLEPLVLSFTGTYVGPRFDGNDENNNRFDKLDGYAVLDAKVWYQVKGVKVFAGVNNVLNELYSTVAYSEVYYPMPERNYYGGVAWTF